MRLFTKKADEKKADEFDFDYIIKQICQLPESLELSLKIKIELLEAELKILNYLSKIDYKNLHPIINYYLNCKKSSICSLGAAIKKALDVLQSSKVKATDKELFISKIKVKIKNLEAQIKQLENLKAEKTQQQSAKKLHLNFFQTARYHSPSGRKVRLDPNFPEKREQISDQLSKKRKLAMINKEGFAVPNQPINKKQKNSISLPKVASKSSKQDQNSVKEKINQSKNIITNQTESNHNHENICENQQDDDRHLSQIN